MNIGTKIIEMRKQKDMTQEEFAKIFHVTRQTVSNWEREKSYPDLQTLVQISEEFNVSLDSMLKEDTQMVKKIDSYRNYKKIYFILITFILCIGILTTIYIRICKIQHEKMYDDVIEAGFKNNLAGDQFEKYQGFYVLSENGVDYLVMPKSVGKYTLDNENFWLSAHKGNNDITLVINDNKKITLALYPGDVELDEDGNLVDKSQKLTAEQEKYLNNILTERKEEVILMLNRTLELWESVNP